MPDVDTGSARVFIDGPAGSKMEIKGKDGKSTGVTAYKVGGHFSGSLVLNWENKLFTADTLMPTPSGIGKLKKGMNSFVFMWSYPNVGHAPSHPNHNSCEQGTNNRSDDSTAAKNLGVNVGSPLPHPLHLRPRRLPQPGHLRS